MDDDLLSLVLSWVTLRGEAVYQARLAPPWRLTFPPGDSHVYVVESGRADLRLDNGAVRPLEAGSIALLPHGLGHMLSDDPQEATPPRDAFDPGVFDAQRLLLGDGAETAPTRIIGGRFRYARHPLPPLLRALPTAICLAPPPSGPPDWQQAITFFIRQEVDGRAPGASLMLSRIIELLVIRTLRSWAGERLPAENWLVGRASRLSAALSAMHDHPEQKWTVGGLAALSGMSRSIFAETFTKAIGEPPLRYLARWRLALAADLLTSTDLAIGEIIERVGYLSEPGFSRAFKAVYGVAPNHFRRGSTPEDDQLSRREVS